MDRLIGVPNIQVRLERPKRFRVVANLSYDDAGLARSTQRRLLYPIPNAATHGAFIVEKEDRLCLLLHRGASFQDSNGCVTINWINGFTEPVALCGLVWPPPVMYTATTDPCVAGVVGTNV